MLHKNLRHVIYFIIIFLIVASCAAFGRIAGNGFINLDDPGYITENNNVQAGFNLQTIKWAFTAVVVSNWHPLTLISHALDWSLFGANASGHHLISLLLHIGTVIFLFLFLNKTTNNIWPSAFAAAFFSLHPLRVESVAWAAERKDVLSMFFGMACLYSYALYAEKSKLSRYVLCLTLFILALMSKPMLVTLPFVLLLLDYWPLGRWQNVSTLVKVPVADTKADKKKNKQRKAGSTKEKSISAPLTNQSSAIRSLLWEKAPFIVLAFISSIITLWAQNKGGSVVKMENLPFTERFFNAIVSYAAYLGKTFCPVNLSVFYPYESSLPIREILISGIILIFITLAVLYYIRRLPFLFVGWFWYLGTLIPVIGLVQVGGQAMADRYTYLPSIGIAIMLAWGLTHLFKREDLRRKILFPASIAVLAAAIVLSWQQCGRWKNNFTLFNYALQVANDNYVAHNSLGLALFNEGKTEEAVKHYSESIRIKPNYPYTYNNRGNAYFKLRRHQSAIEDFDKAIRLRQNNAGAYYNRGNTYDDLGRYNLAIEDYNKSISLKPDHAEVYYCRGNAYYKLGQYQQAIEDYKEAIRIKPDYVWAYINRCVAYFVQGDNELGCSDAQKACELGNCSGLKTAKDKGYCR